MSTSYRACSTYKKFRVDTLTAAAAVVVGRGRVKGVKHNPGDRVEAVLLLLVLFLPLSK